MRLPCSSRTRPRRNGSIGHLRPLVGLGSDDRWGRREPRRGVRRLASLLRGDGRAAADRARLRGSALGGRRPPRFRRRSRREGDRRAVVRSLYRAAGAPRATPELGRGQAEHAHPVAVRAVRRGDGSPDRRASFTGCAPGGDAADAAPACGGKPALRRGVHPDAEGSWPATPRRRDVAARRDRGGGAGDGAGHHCGAARRPRVGRESVAPGCLGCREGVLAGLGRRDRRDLPLGARRSSCTRSSARSSCAATAAPRWRAKRSTPSGMCSSATSPTGRFPGPAAPTSTSARPSGSSRSGTSGQRIAPRCWPITT